MEQRTLVSKFHCGQEVSYKGEVGVIRFIDSVYLTICLKRREDGMISDICVVVYSFQWGDIVPL